jgi:hypothetical protein
VRAVASTHLLVFSFGPDAHFEGELMGALERVESGGAVRVVDVLFLGNDAATGELSVFGLPGDATRTTVGRLLDFRLDPVRRRRATERALRDGTTGIAGDEVRALASALEPGSSMAAVLLEHAWARSLDDAVARTGGTPVADRFVDATALTAGMLDGLLRA